MVKVSGLATSLAKHLVLLVIHVGDPMLKCSAATFTAFGALPPVLLSFGSRCAFDF